MTNSRTEYQREWRRTHPENVRKNKRTSYWNNPEKYRKKAREAWHKNKESTTNGKVNDMTANDPRVGLSPTTAFRGSYIRKYARELFDKQFQNKTVKIYTLYKKVRKDKEMFDWDMISLANKKGVENVTEQDMKNIAEKYENLTFPFGS
ncbi:MAG: hypothetical protein J4F36_13010 [Nitrosopumilaceae archaeon]|nr:hypothetical protein [Nitrosopumilaceae archaeon]